MQWARGPVLFMAKPNIEQLRAQARAKHKAATRKVSRLNTQKGVRISGTKLDPRRNPSLLKRYNARQLNAYIRQVDSFLDRKTQFVADAYKRPMKQSVWAEYQRAEREYHARVKRDFDKVANIKLPFQDQTVAQRMAMMTPLHRTAYDPPVNAPYNPTQRSPRMATSEAKLKVLLEDMKERAKPSQRTKEIERDREILAKMADVINEPELLRQTNELSDEQFHLLWNYTGFTNDIASNYEATKKMLDSNQKAHHAEIMRTALKEAYAFIEWGKSLNLG